MTEKTLPHAGRAVDPEATAGVPDRAQFLSTFTGIPTPYVLALPRWPERRIRAYVAVSHLCRGRLEHRVTAGEVGAVAGIHPDTVTRALRELEAERAIYSPDPDTSTDGRRWRFAHVDYTPPPALEVTPERGPDRKRRRKTRGRGARGTYDPRIGSEPESHPILRSGDSRSLDRESPYPDPPKKDLTNSPPSDLSGMGAMEGRMVLELVAWAKRCELGIYEAADVAARLEWARGDVADALGVCPLPREWVAFARDTWGDPTIKLGARNPLGVALSRKRVVGWFADRYRPVRRANRKRATGPATAEQSGDRVSAAELEAFTRSLRRP